MKKIRRGKSGTAKAAKAALWYAIRRLEAAYAHETDKDSLMKFVYCMTQASGAYGRLVEIVDIDTRLRKLESQLAEEKGSGI